MLEARMLPGVMLRGAPFGTYTYRGGGTRTPDSRFWRPVLYQLSYAPGLEHDCSRAVSDILQGMSERDEDKQENLEPQEQRTNDADDTFREAEEHKGYGEDEGERDESFPKS